jgi:hypothetical protein
MPKSVVLLPPMTGFSAGTSAVFLPVTAWLQAADIAKVRATMEIRGIIANFTCTFGYETADVDNSVSGGAPTMALQRS